MLLVAALHDNGQVSEIVEAANRLTSDPVYVRDGRTGRGDGSRVGQRDLCSVSVIRWCVRQWWAPRARRMRGRCTLPWQQSCRSTSDRAAWHLAESVIGPDEKAATALEAVANRSLAQGNAAVLLRALEAAARLSAPRTSGPDASMLAAEAAMEMRTPRQGRDSGGARRPRRFDEARHRTAGSAAELARPPSSQHHLDGPLVCPSRASRPTPETGSGRGAQGHRG